MITDKVRFVTTEKFKYGNFTFFFGLLGNSVIPKWYFVNEENEAYPTKSSSVRKTESIRILGVSILKGKHFYLPKIKKLRQEHKSTMTVWTVRE